MLNIFCDAVMIMKINFFNRLAILSSPWVFYLMCAILVALGPLTHLALVMLQKILVAEDKHCKGMSTVCTRLKHRPCKNTHFPA